MTEPKFKAIWQKIGSGWDSLHVAVDHRIKFPDSQDEIILTWDAQNSEEFEQYVEELIQELQELKKSARRRFSAKREK